MRQNQHKNEGLSILRWLSRVVYRYDLPTLFGALSLSVLAFFGVMRLNMVSNVAYMLPEDNEAVSDYIDSMERMGTLDYLVVMLTSGEREGLIRFSDTFAEMVMETGMVSEITYRVSEGDKDYIFHKYLPEIFLYLDDECFDEVEKKLSPRAIDEAVAIDKKLLLTPASSGASELVLADPLNFLPIVTDRLFSGQGGFKFDTASGYFLSTDGRHLLMLMTPISPPQDIEFDEALFFRLKAIEDNIKGEGGYEDVVIEYTGGYVIAINDASTIKRDLIVTVISSLILVLLLFYVIFRRLSFLLFVGPSLALGIFWTLGFSGFFPGHLNMVTASFGAILVGLGIDFSIHFYNRFVEEMTSENNLEGALNIAFSRTGSGIVMGGLTTSVAFFSMAFTQFKGLSELGIIGGVGILMTLLATFTVFPSLIVRYIKLRGDNFSFQPISTFGMEMLGRFILRYRRVIIFTSLLLTIFMGMMASRVGFETDIDKLRPEDNPAMEVQRKIWEIFSGSSPEVIVTASASDIEDALVLSEVATELMKGYPEISKVEGPSALLPSLERQSENLDRTMGLDLVKKMAFFKESLTRNGFIVEPFNPFIESMLAFSNGEVKPVTFEAISETTAIGMIKKYLVRDDDRWHVSIFAYPHSGTWEDDIDRGMVRELKGLSKNSSGEISIASISMVLAEMREIISRDFMVAVIIALLGVFFALSIQFREFKGVFYSILSLSMSVIWMLGIMGILGLTLNFANIVVAPMVIGIGIDDNIHLYHRIRERKNGGVLNAVSFSGRAIVMTTLTTVVGFGSLTFASYGGLKSIGYLAILGVTSCLIAALFVMPSLMALKSEKGDSTI